MLGELLGACAPGQGVVLGPLRKAAHSDDAALQFGTFESVVAGVQTVCIDAGSTVHIKDCGSAMRQQCHEHRDSGAFIGVEVFQGACLSMHVQCVVALHSVQVPAYATRALSHLCGDAPLTASGASNLSRPAVSPLVSP